MRLIPVSYESCDREVTKRAPEAMWDGKATIDSKWCCAHDGFDKSQVHWVAVDLGQVFELSKITVYHEGHAGRENVRFNTEDFAVYASRDSIRGPWRQIARVADNMQSFSSLVVNGERARFLKLEITDPMCMHKPDVPNDDWASRILEWDITGSEIPNTGSRTPVDLASPGAVPAVTRSAPALPAVTAPPSSPPSAAGTRPTVYFFYRNDHAESRSYYNEMFLKPEHLLYVGQCTVVPVEMTTDSQKAGALGVIRSPTIVMLGPDGRSKASLIGVQNAEAFVKFFTDNAK